MGTMTKARYQKARPRPLAHGAPPKRGRLSAEPKFPHPGPYDRTWLACKTCGYHWFPAVADKLPDCCPYCERLLEPGRYVQGMGQPRYERELPLCKCYRCGYEWFARKVPNRLALPRYCGNPKCTSPFWAWPRVLGVDAGGEPIIWDKVKRAKAAKAKARTVRRMHGDAEGGGLLI